MPGCNAVLLTPNILDRTSASLQIDGSSAHPWQRNEEADGSRGLKPRRKRARAWCGAHVNRADVYAPDAHMGLHQDRDERDFAARVVSLSLGPTCLFHVGGTTRRHPTHAFRLASGDALVLAGKPRLAFHGVDRIIRDTSTLLPDGSRINLTLRRVNAPTAGSTAAAPFGGDWPPDHEVTT